MPDKYSYMNLDQQQPEARSKEAEIVGQTKEVFESQLTSFYTASPFTLVSVPLTHETADQFD